VVEKKIRTARIVFIFMYLGLLPEQRLFRQKNLGTKNKPYHAAQRNRLRQNSSETSMRRM
jgi:hypothetical protein